MLYAIATTLILVLLVSWVLTLIGLPGNWLMLLAVACYAVWGPAEGRLDVTWRAAIALLVLALIGELLEFLAGALGTKQAGGSNRSAALSIAGSVIGAIAGAIIGLPIPVIGPVVAAVLFAAIGALIGGLAGERWIGRDWSESVEVGKAAFRGRLLGTLAKLAVGTIMVLVAIFALVI